MKSLTGTATMGELYDLKADLQETHNLWDERKLASVRAELSLQLIDCLTQQMDESPRAQRLA